MTTIEVKTTVDASNAAHMAALALFLQSISGVENNSTQAPETPQSVEEKPAKAKAKTTKAKKQEPETEAAEEKPVNSKKVETDIKIEEVRALLAQKVGDHREEIKAKLAELNAKSVTLLDPSDYREFMDFMNDL